MVGLTSAAGLVGFLAEPDPQLRTYALRRLDDEVDVLWPEVADSVDQLEALYEDEAFPERSLAALVVARIYYHLQEYNESMVFALGAGKLFDLDRGGEFEETIIAKCVETYIALSARRSSIAPADLSEHLPPELMTAFPQNADGATSMSASLTSPTTPFTQSTLPSKSLLSRESTATAFDPALANGGPAGGRSHAPLSVQRSMEDHLQAVIDQLFEKCFCDGRYRQVIGIAIEARNLDVLKGAILRAMEDESKRKMTTEEKQKKKNNNGRKETSNGKRPAEGTPSKGDELMEYVLDMCMTVVQERSLRNAILKLVLDLLLTHIPKPDYFAIAKCVVYLNEHELASRILRQLVETGDAPSLAMAYQIAFDLYDNGTQEYLAKVRDGLPLPEPRPASSTAPGVSGAAESAGQEREQPREADGGSVVVVVPQADAANRVDGGEDSALNMPEERVRVYSTIGAILKGTKSIELNLEFLFRNNHTDVTILNRVKDGLDARNSIFHNAVSFANAFMNAGTTSDVFFRKNLEWLGKAVNWSKFTATAALGVIHRGNLGQGRRLLEPYLPRDAVVAGSVYSQGGSLYALGLIYANHGTRVLDYLRDQFRKAEDEVVQHGGALGLGVAGMATGSDDIYEELKSRLYADSAVNGEAVGLAMGLVMLGTGSARALEDMIRYAHETQHEKIVRGLAVGMGLIMFGRQEAADELIGGLLDDPDPTLRYGGIMMLAMAYCGTGSNKAVRRLLHVAVSDVNDDVRRVAVMSLGFILFRKPSSVPGMVELLSESYNPHVRYGAAMALGISCAGTGLDEAIDLLEPMVKDPMDFVRQGALIALSMILVEQNEAMNPKVATVRKTLQRIIGDRHEDAMAKFGCALALGIIDAGGRNCTIGLQTQTGNLNVAAVVGMAVFCQYWYWFPLTHFLSLSFTPTSIVGLDQGLDVPRLRMHCAARPNLFDYPPEQEVKADEAPEKVATAVLSTTMQAKRRAQRKEEETRQLRRESMDLDHDQTPTTPKTAHGPTSDEKMDVDVVEDDNEDAEGDRVDDDDGKGKSAAAAAAAAATTTTANTEAGDGKTTDGDDASKKKGTDKEKERIGYEMENMSRVLPAQLKHITIPGGRYEPVKKPTGGVIVLIDTQPSEPKDLLELKAKRPTESNAASEAVDGRVDTDENSTHQTPVGEGDGGAAEAAGVLTAVDEDEEGVEEAELPRDFDYYSDGSGEAD